MSDMVERVAKAIAETEYGPGCTVDHMQVLQACAAVKAMRDPTEAMVAVGDDKIGECIHFYAGGSCHIVDGAASTAAWQAMIDAALKGEAE